jgi:predicted enzyme related to lactoylglutathione lyase
MKSRKASWHSSVIAFEGNKEYNKGKGNYDMQTKSSFGFFLEYVNDIEAAKYFYSEVLGLAVQRTSPTFVQFEHFAIASDESLSGTNEPEVYWQVENAQAAFEAISRGAEVILPPTQKPFGTVFAVRSPSGQALYLIEFARQRPSQTVG